MVPYDLEQQRKETREMLDDLTTRDQRMLFAVVTLVHLADSKEELDSDTETLRSTARKHLCQLSTLNWQQADGLVTALPLGLRRIDALRTLTTEALAVLMPFKAQEIRHQGGVYYGQNTISKNLILANRKELLNGNGYLCKAMQTQYSDQLYKKKVHVIGSLSELYTKKSKFKDRPLLIFDDFIGSGKYASEVLDELVSIGIPTSNVVICSLFISELGLQKISSKDCHIEYIEVAQSIIDKLLEKEKDLLKHIETSLGVKEDFKFGYGRSANLISLLRTPNNSLPVFWLDKGGSHSAPFPR